MPLKLRYLMNLNYNVPQTEMGLFKSIKCSECGKVFKNTALANYHAEKSGHDQFEESTEEVNSFAEVLIVSDLPPFLSSNL